MILNHNIATKKIAYVFINSECRGIAYSNAQKRGKLAQKLFDEIFEFEEVHTLRDPSKNVLENALNRIKEQAKDFEEEVSRRYEKSKNEAKSQEELVIEQFKIQVNTMKKYDEGFDPSKCQYEKQNLD